MFLFSRSFLFPALTAITRLWGGGVFLLSVYFLIRDPEHLSGFVILFASSIIAIAAIFLSFFSSKFIWIKITLISTVLSVYLFEGYIFITKGSSQFFYPTILHKVLAYRSKGIDAHPMIYPSSRLLEFKKNVDLHIFPIGGVPNTRTVNCHEDDGIVSYQSDQFGFNNPVNSWKDYVRFAFVGDSYAHGMCMQNPNTFVGIFRQAFPSTVNIAVKGNGPLIQLAGVREYISMVKPKIVFWTFYIGNDFGDLEREMTIETLRNYLAPNFSQNLVSKKEEVKDQLIKYSEEKIRERLSSGFATRTVFEFMALLARKLTFHDVSSLLDQAFNSAELERAQEKRLNAMALRRETASFDDAERLKSLLLLQKILFSVKNQIETWQGRLVMVVIADRISCVIKGKDRNYQAVKMISKKLKVDLIDTIPKNCNDQSPNKFYSPGFSHFNHEGNQWLGNRLIDYATTSGR